MPKDHRFLQSDGPKTAVVVVVQVRSADPSGRHAQADLTGKKGILGPVFDPEIAGGVDDDSLHSGTGVIRGWPAKCAVRLSRISLPIAFRVSMVPEP